MIFCLYFSFLFFLFRIFAKLFQINKCYYEFYQDHNCLESCVKKCQTEHVTGSCEKKCGHCLKKTKQKLQIITEYENECVSGNCNETSKNTDHPGNTNFTTNIEIHNVIGNGSGTCCRE